MNTKTFMNFRQEFEDAKICILGTPYDATETYRRGTRLGPAAIRKSSFSIEEYSPVLDLDLGDMCIADLGDVFIADLGDVEVRSSVNETIQEVERRASEIAFNDKMPVVLGGEHLISLGVVRALVGKYGDLEVVQFDAHLDLRDEYAGEKLSHSTVMRRIYEITGNIYQIGIRSGSKEEFDFAKENTQSYGVDDICGGVSDVITKIGKKPAYVTIDIDVLDPAYACGTSNPEPCGISTVELINAIYKMQGLNIVGFDLVEVCPQYDPSEVTSITAAKIIREGILSFF